jgi:hypothetical protein
MKYKNQRILRDEIFILSHLFLVSKYALRGNPSLSAEVEDVIKYQIATFSNKTYAKWQNKIALINFEVKMYELIGEEKSSHKFVIVLHALLQKIIDSDYKFPAYIADIFQKFLDIEAEQKIDDDDWFEIKESSNVKADELLARLQAKGLFNKTTKL